MPKESSYDIERYPMEREGHPGSYTIIHTPHNSPTQGSGSLNMIYRTEYTRHPRLKKLWDDLRRDAVFTKPFWGFCKPETVLGRYKDAGMRSLLYLVLRSAETEDPLMLLHLGVWDNSRREHNNIWKNELYDH